MIDWEVEALIDQNEDRAKCGEDDEARAALDQNLNSTSTCDNRKDSNDVRSYSASAGKTESRVEDVCATPKALLREVLVVLDILGPWCKCSLVRRSSLIQLGAKVACCSASAEKVCIVRRGTNGGFGLIRHQSVT